MLRPALLSLVLVASCQSDHEPDVDRLKDALGIGSSGLRAMGWHPARTMLELQAAISCQLFDGAPECVRLGEVMADVTSNELLAQLEDWPGDAGFAKTFNDRFREGALGPKQLSCITERGLLEKAWLAGRCLAKPAIATTHTQRRATLPTFLAKLAAGGGSGWTSRFEGHVRKSTLPSWTRQEWEGGCLGEAGEKFFFNFELITAGAARVAVARLRCQGD